MVFTTERLGPRPVLGPGPFGPRAHWAQGPLVPGPVWAQVPFGPRAHLDPGTVWAQGPAAWGVSHLILPILGGVLREP